MRGLGSFDAIERAALTPVIHAGGIEYAPEYVIADARQVFDAAATHKDYRVFLQVVALARDVAGHFVAGGEADFADFAQGRVGFLGGRGVNASTNAALLRVTGQRRGLGMMGDRHAGTAH
jgi:hypothetical protein